LYSIELYNDDELLIWREMEGSGRGLICGIPPFARW
jgi:hypothetical protein